VLAQVLPSLLLLARWLRRKNSPTSIRPVGAGTIRRATRYALLAGLTWGALPLLMRGVTSREEMAVCIIVTAMAAGSATTLAAIPAAAMSYVVASIVPFVVYFAGKNDPAYALLALLALCFTVAAVLGYALVLIFTPGSVFRKSCTPFLVTFVSAKITSLSCFKALRCSSPRSVTRVP